MLFDHVYSFFGEIIQIFGLVFNWLSFYISLTYNGMDVEVGLWRKLGAEELMLLNCGVGEDSRVPWTARRSNQSILKEIIPGCSLEGLMLKLKFQYFGHLMWRTDSLEKTLMLGGIGGRRRRGWQRMRWLMASPTRWTWVWVNSRSWWWTGKPGVLWFMGSQRVRHDWVTELNWTECIMMLNIFSCTVYIFFGDVAIKIVPIFYLSCSFQLKYNWFTVLCYFLVYGKVIQIDIDIFFFILFYSMVYYRILNIFLCAIQ